MVLLGYLGALLVSLGSLWGSSWALWGSLWVVMWQNVVILCIFVTFLQCFCGACLVFVVVSVFFLRTSFSLRNVVEAAPQAQPKTT